MTEQAPRKGRTLWDAMVAGLVGLGTGAVAFTTTVRREFWDDIKDIDEIKTHTSAATKEIRKVESDDPLYAKLARGARHKKIAEIKSNRDKDIAKVLEERGYRSHGLTGLTLGTLDRIGQMSPRSKWTIGLSSVISTVIGAGATYTFLSNRDTRERVGATYAKIDELATKLDAKATDGLQAQR